MSLLALPSEIRNKVYSTVIANTPQIPDWKRSPFSGEFSLCQPALAKVNQQLRREILPMWYSAKSFSIRIHPKTRSEADQVWQEFLGRFNALGTASTAHGRSSYLSHIQRLEVELRHPANDICLHHGLGTCDRSAVLPGVFSITHHGLLGGCNVAYLQFGPVTKLCSHRRLGGGDTDWTDRDLVRALLRAAILEQRRGPFHGFFDSSLRPDRFELFRKTFELFWKTFPFDRLVDLTMMIAVECKEAAGLVHVGTSFATL